MKQRKPYRPFAKHYLFLRVLATKHINMAISTGCQVPDKHLRQLPHPQLAHPKVHRPLCLGALGVSGCFLLFFGFDTQFIMLYKPYFMYIYIYIYILYIYTYTQLASYCVHLSLDVYNAAMVKECMSKWEATILGWFMELPLQPFATAASRGICRKDLNGYIPPKRSEMGWTSWPDRISPVPLHVPRHHMILV